MSYRAVGSSFSSEKVVGRGPNGKPMQWRRILNEDGDTTGDVRIDCDEFPEMWIETRLHDDRSKRIKTDANVMLIMTHISCGQIKEHAFVVSESDLSRKGIKFDSGSSYKTYKATDGEGMFDDVKHLPNESVCMKTLLVMYD